MQSRIEGVISRIDRLGGEIVAIEIVAPEGQQLPRFEAGAHVELQVRANIIRPYSICSDPADPSHYRFGILRDANSRGGSDVICTQWAVGDRIRMSEPRNLFPLEEQAGESILIAGGVGITPLMAMAWRLRDLGRKFALHYCVRAEDRAAFLPELVERGFADVIRPHFSQVQRFDFDRDIGSPREGAHIYVCGPQGFMDYVLDRARLAGWSDAQVHYEYFDAETDVSGGPFSVRLNDGKIVDIPAGQSAASILIELGYEVEVSCEKGICGSCITTVLAGSPDHRDHYLTDDEKARNDCMALCCSRAFTPEIVLDL